MSGLRRTYRVLRWVALGWLALILVLILRQSPPPQTDTDPRAPERLQEKFARLDEATSLGEPHDLELDEAELNVLMRSNLGLDDGGPQGPVSEESHSGLPASAPLDGESTLSVEEVQSSIRDFRLDLSGDRISAYVVYNLYGKNLSLVLEGRLYSRSGSVRFQPTGAVLGSLRIPGAVINRAVARHFDNPENHDKLRLPPQVKDLRVKNGALVVSYR